MPMATQASQDTLEKGVKRHLYALCKGVNPEQLLLSLKHVLEDINYENLEKRREKTYDTNATINMHIYTVLQQQCYTDHSTVFVQALQDCGRQDQLQALGILSADSHKPSPPQQQHETPAHRQRAPPYPGPALSLPPNGQVFHHSLPPPSTVPPSPNLVEDRYFSSPSRLDPRGRGYHLSSAGNSLYAPSPGHPLRQMSMPSLPGRMQGTTAEGERAVRPGGEGSGITMQDLKDNLVLGKTSAHWQHPLSQPASRYEAHPGLHNLNPQSFHREHGLSPPRDDLDGLRGVTTQNLTNFPTKQTYRDDALVSEEELEHQGPGSLPPNILGSVDDNMDSGVESLGKAVSARATHLAGVTATATPQQPHTTLANMTCGGDTQEGRVGPVGAQGLQLEAYSYGQGLPLNGSHSSQDLQLDADVSGQVGQPDADFSRQNADLASQYAELLVRNVQPEQPDSPTARHSHGHSSTHTRHCAVVTQQRHPDTRHCGPQDVGNEQPQRAMNVTINVGTVNIRGQGNHVDFSGQKHTKNVFRPSRPLDAELPPGHPHGGQDVTEERGTTLPYCPADPPPGSRQVTEPQAERCVAELGDPASRAAPDQPAGLVEHPQRSRLPNLSAVGMSRSATALLPTAPLPSGSLPMGRSLCSSDRPTAADIPRFLLTNHHNQTHPKTGYLHDTVRLTQYPPEASDMSCFQLSPSWHQTHLKVGYQQDPARSSQLPRTSDLTDQDLSCFQLSPNRNQTHLKLGYQQDTARSLEFPENLDIPVHDVSYYQQSSVSSHHQTELKQAEQDSARRTELPHSSRTSSDLSCFSIREAHHQTHPKSAGLDQLRRPAEV